MEWLDVIDQTSSDKDAEACCARSEVTATTDHTESTATRRTKARIGGKKKLVWTREEDVELQRLMHKHGCDWDLLAAHFPDRTSESIQQRWEDTQEQDWTSAQDRKIKLLVGVYGTNWKELSRQIGRPASEVKARYFVLQESSMDIESPSPLVESLAAEKEVHLNELYEQLDIMKDYLEGLARQMSRLQTDLSETLETN
jgi:hypothetical protein